MNRMSTQFDKFIVSAMDRFVWFILLIVMSHLVTEFTKTNGYTQSHRQNLIPINESVFINAIEVPNLTQFPNHNLDMIQESDKENTDTSSNGEEKTFSLRPIIDSIFDIPLSALNAVNRLVQRLTGSYSYYTHTTSTTLPEKSTLKEKNV